MSKEALCDWRGKSSNKTCQHPKQSTKPQCIGHDADTTKDREAFAVALDVELKSSDKSVYDFQGWIFPAGLNIENMIFARPVNFSEAQIRGNASFNSSEFGTTVSFEDTHFEGEASFIKTKFGAATENTKVEAATESEIEFGFVRTRFGGEVAFKAQFFNPASFDGATFQVGANFDDTHFEANASFSGAAFKTESASFKNTHFNSLIFTSCNFDKVAKFDQTTFHSFLSFEKSIFTDGAEFTNTHFKGYVDFKNAVFTTATLFDDAKFEKGHAASFENVQFNEYVSFKKTEFNRIVLFTGTIFKKAAFENTRFLDETKFEQATLTHVDFKGTKFRKLTKFDDLQFTTLQFLASTSTDGTVEFCGDTSFSRLKFIENGLLLLDRVKFCGTVVFDLQVDKRNQFIFRKVDLSKALFGKSNIQKVEFEDVSWPQTKFRRLKIADEPSVSIFHGKRKHSAIRKLKEVRRLYRQLRLNHDEVGEYDKAGKFYVSESEMRYLSHPPIIRWIHLRGLYRLASRYGESIVQASIMLVSIVVSFGVLYWLICPPQFKEVPKALGTNFSGCFSWGEAMWFSLNASKPLANLGLSPQTSYYWIALLEGFLVPIQIGLFLLAVRRRFRRGD